MDAGSSHASGSAAAAAAAAPFIPIFEKETPRVKGLSFHPVRPWVLLGLHTGAIQLWDYSIKLLIDQFDKHKGPVRSVAFHPTQLLFVSGGDDDKIKVWNYKEKKCIFAFSDHMDYIRTVEFHHEYPWILSCSDDQTIRIWNWQSRQFVTALLGHSHYVMCAKFHPTEDLIISASLDNTVRIWDISALRKKHVVPDSASGFQSQMNLIGEPAVVPKFILTVNDGVNWACFHPTLPLIVSASDDRQIKLWRYSDTRAWEIDTFHGHYNNVSCCAFHPKKDILVSCSEDKTLRIWDVAKRTLIYTRRSESDRFWMVTMHPTRNLVAAGHDSGFMVFKLEKERPCFCVFEETVFYVRENALRAFELRSGITKEVLSLRAHASPPRGMQYNRQEAVLLITYEGADMCYELYNIEDIHRGDVKVSRGAGGRACWVNDSCFAMLDAKANTLTLKTSQNTVFSAVPSLSLDAAIDAIFPAATDRLFIHSGGKMYLFDVKMHRVVAETAVAGNVKFSANYVGARPEDGMVAFMGEKAVHLCTMDLAPLCAIEGQARVKSGVWSQRGVFFCTVTSHIMYLLPNGDTGIVRTLSQPIYLVAVLGDKIHCFDRDAQNRTITIDDSEISLKYALWQQNFKEAFSIIAKSDVLGQSIVTYLQQKGHPALAFHFARDSRQRFDLALECGYLDQAYEAACLADQMDLWQQLAQASSKQGCHDMAELVYKRINDFESLLLLYLAAGRTDALSTLSNTLSAQGNVSAILHLSFVSGDAPTRVELLRKAGILPLAYLTARTYGLEEEAEKLKKQIATELGAEASGVAELEAKSRACAGRLRPPMPVARVESMDWPRLVPEPTQFDELLKQGELRRSSKAAAVRSTEEAWEFEGESAWDDGVGEERQEEVGSGESEGEDNWQFEREEWTIMSPEAERLVELPEEGPSCEEVWEVSESDVAVDHVAAGSFRAAMELLNRQIGVVNFEPLKASFVQIASSSRAYLRLQPSTPMLAVPLIQGAADGSHRGYLSGVRVTELIDALQLAYNAFSLGKFQDALAGFRGILQRIPLLHVDSAAEVEEVRELIGIATQYLLCLSIELTRREIAASGPASRVSELAYHFAHCGLNSQHLHLANRLAMNVNVKLKNYAQAESFAQKLLYANPKAEVVQLAQKVIDFCRQNGSRDSNPMDYDERNPSVLCAKSFQPLYKGTPHADCPYCSAHYSLAFTGETCVICQLAQIGAPGCTGLVLRRQSRSS